MAIRVVFFGNSLSTFSARHFAALLDQPCKLIGVVDAPAAKRNSTNPLAAGLLNFAEQARKQDIPAYQPANPNDPAFTAKLADLEADLFLAVGYPVILKEETLALPKFFSVNFHASLLPDYRGKHPVFWALRNGEKWSGLTVHVMDPGIDTGNIIYQVKIRTRRDDTVASLYRRIMDQSVDLVRKLIADTEHNNIPRRPQPRAGSYYSSTTEGDFRIDWTLSAERIRRFITVTPGKCFAEIAGKKVYFFNAQKESGITASSPGTIINIRYKRAAVATGTGILSSSVVRIDDEEIDSFAGYCRQAGFRPGDSLIS